MNKTVNKTLLLILVSLLALAGCYTPRYHHPPGIPLRWDSEKKMSVPDYSRMNASDYYEIRPRDR